MRRRLGPLLCCLVLAVSGCATTKHSDTARTGVEQLLISSATDQALDKVNFESIRHAKVFVETKYLECTDKNYIIVALHQRLMRHGATLVDKAEDAQVALPRMEVFTRTKAMGTAKLTILAYDAKSRLPVVDSGNSLARSDYRQWAVMGSGPMVSGRVPAELTAATGESESVVPLQMPALAKTPQRSAVR